MIRSIQGWGIGVVVCGVVGNGGECFVGSIIRFLGGIAEKWIGVCVLGHVGQGFSGTMMVY